MNTVRKIEIQAALQAFGSEDLMENALTLFSVLGYNTSRQSKLDNATYGEFEKSFIEQNNNITDIARFKEKAQTDKWEKVELLFQITDLEMIHQGTSFNVGKFDNTIINAYLFFAIELSPGKYTRTNLSDITRQINRVFFMPVMLLFKYNNNITLSIIKRRLHKKDESRDVLEKVTLIKDISIKKPHRAHIEILFDLSLEELRKKHSVNNFVELQKAWQKTLDSSELNKKFYHEIANWYFWAVENVEFPDDMEKNREIRNATAVIRLLTRIIFIWFIKEKSVIPEPLFQKEKLKEILKNFTNPENSDTTIFYKAILQNLFFATLSTEKDKRKFRGKNWRNGKNVDFGNQYVYRYESLVSDTDRWKALFADIPFLNGGLFENLDNKRKRIMVDGFSEEKRNNLNVPDFLFFSGERNIDLNKTFDTKGKKYKVKGLLKILNQYKFTVAENTPVEEEIALDPELLGKVFENLLASFNPETKTTARKQTGSFYTPREIVDYMVDESLKASLSLLVSDKLKNTTSEDIKTGLDILFAYTEKEHAFNDSEVKEIIKAVSEIKILDPACGSGAFPMGILHKLVYILNKLDPDNAFWLKIQKKKAIKETEEAYNLGKQKERQQRIKEIEETFDFNTSDYGRKLFLIENAIYGVDIQPIAVQIAKLRFFISLIVDQDMKINIKPLPNLETKFVAANTLIGRKKKEVQRSLFDNPEIEKLEDVLKSIRHKHFNARNPKAKLRLRKQDKNIREKIATFIEESDGDEIRAKQLTSWDPYDQNLYASFFDSEWMFGIKEGFDIAIGNPPYLKERDNKKVFKSVNNSDFGKKYHQGKMDYWYYFLHKAIDVVRKTGAISYITSRYWLNSSGAKKLIKRVKKELSFVNFVDIGKLKVFDEVAGHHMVAVYQRQKKEQFIYKQLINNLSNIYSDIDTENVQIKYLSNKDVFSDTDEVILNKSFYNDTNIIKLGTITDISQGVVEAPDKLSNKQLKKVNRPNYYVGDGVFVLSKNEIKNLNLNKKEKLILKKYLDPNDIVKYLINYKDKYLIYSDKKLKEKIKRDNQYLNLKKHLDRFKIFVTSSNKPYGLHRPREQKYFEKPKIIFKNMFVNVGFSFDDEGKYYFGFSFSSIIQKNEKYDLKYILAILNSKFAENWFYNNGKKRGAGVDIGVQKLRQFPIKNIDNNKQKPFISLVNTILATTKSEDYSKNSAKQAKVKALEAEIDQLVYKLYDLTPEEIKIVEGETMDKSQKQISENLNDDSKMESNKKEEIICPNCGTPMVFKKGDYSDFYHCPKCKKTIVVSMISKYKKK